MRRRGKDELGPEIDLDREEHVASRDAVMVATRRREPHVQGVEPPVRVGRHHANAKAHGKAQLHYEGCEPLGSVDVAHPKQIWWIPIHDDRQQP